MKIFADSAASPALTSTRTRLDGPESNAPELNLSMQNVRMKNVREHIVC